MAWHTLILDRIEILPGFRGYNLGLAVMRRLIERFGADGGIVAIKPFPIQRELTGQEEDEWRQKMRLADFEQSLPRATARLRRHYAQLGFKFVKGTPFMFGDAQIALPALTSLRQGRSMIRTLRQRSLANSAGRVKALKGAGRTCCWQFIPDE